MFVKRITSTTHSISCDKLRAFVLFEIQNASLQRSCCSTFCVFQHTATTLLFCVMHLSTWTHRHAETIQRETKPSLHKRVSQHRSVKTSGPESAVLLHLKDKGHIFKDNKVHNFVWKRSERSYTKVENLFLSWGGGLWHELSPIFHAALSSIPSTIKNNSHVHREGQT